jgi:hypothetical protein
MATLAAVVHERALAAAEAAAWAVFPQAAAVETVKVELVPVVLAEMHRMQKSSRVMDTAELVAARDLTVMVQARQVHLGLSVVMVMDLRENQAWI